MQHFPNSILWAPSVQVELQDTSIIVKGTLFNRAKESDALGAINTRISAHFKLKYVEKKPAVDLTEDYTQDILAFFDQPRRPCDMQRLPALRSVYRHIRQTKYRVLQELVRSRRIRRVKKRGHVMYVARGL